MKNIKLKISIAIIVALIILLGNMSYSLASGQYNIIFDPNGGTMDSTTIQINNGEPYGELPVPTREGYTFNGWYLKNYQVLENVESFYDDYFSRNVLRLSCGPATSNGQFTNGRVLEFDVTIGNTVPVGIDINDNDITSSEFVIEGNRVYGTIIITDEHYRRWGNNSYSFLDINCANSVETYTINNAKLYESTSSSTSGEEIKSDSIFNESSDTALIADWIEDVYCTVDFDSNGAKEDIPQRTIRLGEKVTEPTKPTKDNFEFDAWYSDRELTKKFSFDTAVTENIVLFAKWNPVFQDVMIEMTEGLDLEDDSFTAIQSVALEFVAYKMYTVSQVDRTVFEVKDKAGKTLFIVDNGVVSLSNEVSYLDNVEYILTDAEKEEIIDEYGDCFINKITIIYGTAPETVQYKIVEGMNQTYTRGDTSSLNVKADGPLSKFVSLKVDGVVVDESNYLKAEGSTVVSLKPEYINTLAVGEHTLTFVYTNGEVSTNFTIAEKVTSEDVANPKTGDLITIWLGIFAISTIGLIGSFKGIKRK